MINLQQRSQEYTIKGFGEAAQPHAKKCNCTTILHHTQKSTENGLET